MQMCINVSIDFSWIFKAKRNLFKIFLMMGCFKNLCLMLHFVQNKILKQKCPQKAEDELRKSGFTWFSSKII